MAFYLKIIGGADDGTTHKVDTGDVVIGRAPTAKIQLRDESIAWEHVIVRDTGARLVVVNLAAAGTKVRGKRVTEETRIASGEEIQLSAKVKAVVESRAAGSSAGGLSRMTLVLLGLVIVLIFGGGAALMLSGDKRVGKPPMTAAHWRQAYSRISDRMEKWVGENRFPREAMELFHDAWRLEQAGNTKGAYQHWNQLQRVLNSLPNPISNGGVGKLRISEAANPTYTALEVISGRDQSAASAQFNWDSDEAVADALVWFVRISSDSLGKQLKE